MCFSANASFAAAGTLSVIGLLSVHAANTRNKKLIPLATIPLFFAVQQACEGIVWVTLNNGDTTSSAYLAGTVGFLFFASVWWPVWIPYTLLIAEKIRWRKIFLILTIPIGEIVAIMLVMSWILYTTGPQIIGHHIDYPVPNYPFGIANTCIAQTISWAISAMYCIATILPFFISSITCMWAVGVIASIGLIVAYIFYFIAFPSVWCFFEAISSIALYFVIKNSK